MKHAKVTGEIVKITRLANSVNGNPNYELVLDVHSGEEPRLEKYRTSSDISDAYKVGNVGMRVDDIVTLTLTGTGRIAMIKAAPAQ